MPKVKRRTVCAGNIPGLPAMIALTFLFVWLSILSAFDLQAFWPTKIDIGKSLLEELENSAAAGSRNSEPSLAPGRTSKVAGTSFKHLLGSESSTAPPYASEAPLQDQALLLDKVSPAGSDKHGAVDKHTHLCFCTDDRDLRPMMAAINSTVANSVNPSKLVIHIISSKEKVDSYGQIIRQKIDLKGAVVTTHHNSDLHQHIRDIVTFRNTSEARQELSSPFNFAPFYMDQFIGNDGPLPERLLYLDTDVIVEGDLSQLVEISMNDFPVAAVEDCLQHLAMYIIFDVINRMGWMRKGVTGHLCVFNRGVFLMDVRKWREMRMTDEIELWMKRYRETQEDIYKYGMSQPPWLLAVAGRYKKLTTDWNCRGLGRDSLTTNETLLMKRAGLNKKARKALGLELKYGIIKPFVALCSNVANVLHFNGRIKPWFLENLSKNSNGSVCANRLPDVATASVATAHARDPVYAHDQFSRCAGRWWHYLSRKLSDDMLLAKD